MSDDDNVVPMAGRRPAASTPVPIATLEAWLKRTEAVEVDQDEPGPYATPGAAVPEWPYRVWASNGVVDPRTWAGSLVARCKSQEDADLVAEALRRMQQS